MPCSINLFNALPTAGPAISTSGAWYFIGYNATTAAGPWTWVSGMPSGLPTNTPPFNVMGGYNQTLNFTGISALGFYKFEYRTGTPPCIDTAELIIEAKPSNFPGQAATRWICPSLDPYDFSTTSYFNTGVGTGPVQLGTVTLTPPVPGALFGGLNNNIFLDPSLFTPGTYTLGNSVTVTPSYSTDYPAPTNGAICPTCQYGTRSVNSTIIAQPDPSAPVINTCVDPPPPFGEWTTIDIGALTTSLPGNQTGKWYISSYNGGLNKSWRINGVIVGNVGIGANGGNMWNNTSVYDNVFEVFLWNDSNPITLNFAQGTSFYGTTPFPGFTPSCTLVSSHTFNIGSSQLDGHFYTDMGNCVDYSNWQINKFWTNATINDQSGATEWVGGTPISMGTLTPTTVNSTTYFTNFMNTANSIGVPGFTFSVPNIFTPTATGGCSVGWTLRVRVQSTFTGNWVIEWEDMFLTHKFRAEHVAGVLNTYRWNGSSWVAWTGYYSVPNVVTTYTTC